MAEIKFGAYSNAYYGEVTKADRPKSSGLTLVPINRYSGKPVVDTDVAYYGNKPGDVIERLYKDGIPAQGLINNKFYRDGQELSAEQVQAQRVENVAGIAGELASLGLRTPVGTGGSQFVRDAAAEKKFVETVRANIKAGRPAFEGTAGAGLGSGAGKPISFEERNKYYAQASDEEIIASVGGVNKFGVVGSGYGINALYDPYSSNVPLPGGEGYGTGIYGGTGPGQYTQGSRAITESDILALGKLVGNAANDPQAAANASKQLRSIFENDPSFVRREQARDALSYGLPGYPGGPAAPTSARGATGVMGASTSGRISVGPNGVITYTASDGKQFTNPDSYTSYQSNLDTQKASRQSAYDELYQEFDQYGLASLVTPLKSLIEDGIDVRSSAFKLKLRESEEYKKRFAANAQRLQKGLRALSEAEYLGLEDAYQEKMRQYGLPESYYTKGELGRQAGFEKLIAGGVAPTELEDRLQTAYDRVINAAPEVSQALKQFYPDITNGDVLAFVLDPENARDTIKRKVTAAEIGGAAMAEGLTTGLARAEELQRFGVTGAGYREVAPVIKQAAERGSQLTSFYDQGQFDQTTAEQAALGISGSAEARKKMKKLTELEQASFSGSTGRAGGALARERAGQF
jgi:hypothetical protein